MVKELQKEKIRIRKENPTRAVVLGNLIEGAKKIAKEENREPNENDIIVTAKKIIKTLIKALGEMKPGPLGDSYLAEIKICTSFLPDMVSEDVISDFIDSEISKLEEKSMRSMGTIIGKIKAKYGEAIDMSYVSKTVKERLS